MRVKVFEKIAGAVKEHPWTIVFACALLTAGLGCGILFLKGHVTYQGLLPRDFPSVKALESLRRNFGGISYEYVLLRGPDMTGNEMVEELVKLDDSMAMDPRFNKGQVEMRKNAAGRTVPVIQDYLSPFMAIMEQEISSRGISIPISTVTSDMVKQFTGKDFHGIVSEDYLGDPRASGQVVGRFITPDRKTALVMVKEGKDISETGEIKLGSDIQDFFVQRFGRIPGLKISISGDATLARDFNRHITHKTVVLLLVALALVVLSLFVAFRRVSDTLLPLAVMLLGVVWTFGFAGWAGIEYTVAVIAVMPLLLGTALTFVVPLVARYYEEAESFRHFVESAGRALVAVGVAIFLAAITNVVGFLVFGFSVLPALRDFGIICGVGTIFVFGLSVVLLPAVIVLRDRTYERVTGRKSCKASQYFDGLSLRKKRGVFSRAIDRVLDSFTRLSVAHAVPVIIVFAAFVGFGFLQIQGLTTDSDLRKLVPRSLPGMAADFQLEKYFGGQQQDVLEVRGDVLAPSALEAMARLEKAVASPEYVGSRKDLYTSAGITGLPDAIVAANDGKMPATKEEALGALENAESSGGYVEGGLINRDHDAALVTFNATGAQSTEVVDKKISILKKAAERYLKPAGLEYSLGGITPLTKDMTRNIIPTETWSSLLALGLCAVVLVLIFWSVPYGLITLTVALAGVASEIAFLRISGWPLDIMTSLASALVIGIGVNFGILFTHRFIQEKKDGDLDSADAIDRTMSNLGRANVIAAVTTMAAFVIVMFSGIVPLKRFGGVTAFAVGVCLITSLTLMPALLSLVSRRAESRDESPETA